MLSCQSSVNHLPLSVELPSSAGSEDGATEKVGHGAEDAERDGEGELQDVRDEMRAALAGGAMYIEIAAVLGIKDRFNGGQVWRP